MTITGRPTRAPHPRWRWPLGACVLGHSREREEVWVPAEMRTVHTHVIGASGQGKSKLLEGLIRADVLELDGVPRSVVVVDPHGTLINDLVRWYTTHGLHRVRPLRVLDPSDAQFLFAMNPIRPRPGVDPAVIASAVLNAMAKVWGGEDPRATPQLRESMKAILYTLSALNRTLLDADELMAITDNNRLRKVAIDTIPHPSIRRFWQTIEALRPRERDEKLGSAVRRLNEFLLPQTIRRIVGQREPVIDFREVMDCGEVVLVNLAHDRGRISEDEATLLGTLIVSDIFLSCLGRPKGSTPTFVYIDECQRYLTQDVSHILDEGRKFGVHLTLAHQHLGALREAGEHLYRSVMTNTRTKVVFGGLDDEDATLMARNLFRGTFDLQKSKPRYDKPVVVDQVPMWLRAESEGEGVAHATGVSHSWGGSESISHSTTRSSSTTHSESDTTSESETISESSTDSWGSSSAMGTTRSSGCSQGHSQGSSWGQGRSEQRGSQESASWSRSAGDSDTGTYAVAEDGCELINSRALGANRATSNSGARGISHGSGSSYTRNETTGRNSAASTSEAHNTTQGHSSGHAESRGRATTRGSAHTVGTAYTIGEAETEGVTEGTNWSTGESETDTVSHSHTMGRSQALRSVLRVMPTQAYGLEELVHIASVRLANLQNGEAFVKIGSRPPVRIKTLRIKEGWAQPGHVERVKRELLEAMPYAVRIGEERPTEPVVVPAIAEPVVAEPPPLDEEEWG